MNTLKKLLSIVGLWLAMSVATHAGTVTYVYTDNQGTPLAEADAQGNVTATFDYRPYGAQALGTPPKGPGYTGHVNDPDTGLVYMQARYYDPARGAFLSVDPVTPTTGNAFNFNRYAYADNNPVMHADPDGRCVDGLTCDSIVQSFARHPEAGKPMVPYAIAAAGVMVAASGGAVVVDAAETAVAIDKALSGSPNAAPTTKGVDTGELHAPGDVQNSTVIVRGGAGDPPSGGITYSGSQGATVGDAAKGVPHGQIRATTAGTIKANGGKVDVAPEPMKSGQVNGQHVNVTEAPGQSSLGPSQPNPVPKSDRAQ